MTIEQERAFEKIKEDVNFRDRIALGIDYDPKKIPADPGYRSVLFDKEYQKLLVNGDLLNKFLILEENYNETCITLEDYKEKLAVTEQKLLRCRDQNKNLNDQIFEWRDFKELIEKEFEQYVIELKQIASKVETIQQQFGDSYKKLEAENLQKLPDFSSMIDEVTLDKLGFMPGEYISSFEVIINRFTMKIAEQEEEIAKLDSQVNNLLGDHDKLSNAKMTTNKKSTRFVELKSPSDLKSYRRMRTKEYKSAEATFEPANNLGQGPPSPFVSTRKVERFEVTNFESSAEEKTIPKSPQPKKEARSPTLQNLKLKPIVEIPLPASFHTNTFPMSRNSSLENYDEMVTPMKEPMSSMQPKQWQESEDMYTPGLRSPKPSKRLSSVNSLPVCSLLKAAFTPGLDKCKDLTQQSDTLKVKIDNLQRLLNSFVPPSYRNPTSK